MSDTRKKTRRPVQPSETVEGQLQEYGIAAKLRELPLRRKLGLVQLAAHTGLSPALLSKVERGKLIPTLPTLQRIAMVYGVGMDHFFASRRPQPALSIVRAADRRRFPESAGQRDPAYVFESLTFDVANAACEAYLAHFERPAKPRPHAHDHVEIVYVISARWRCALVNSRSRWPPATRSTSMPRYRTPVGTGLLGPGVTIAQGRFRTPR